MEFLDAYSISCTPITNPGTEVRTVSSKEHHSLCHCCQWRAWFKGWQQRASKGQLLHCPRALWHKTSSHGIKGLNVWWQWQDFGGTLKLSEALAVYYWSVTVPCFLLWLVTKLWGIYLYGNSYFHSASLLKTTVWCWQKQRHDILWTKVSLKIQTLAFTKQMWKEDLPYKLWCSRVRWKRFYLHFPLFCFHLTGNLYALAARFHR